MRVLFLDIDTLRADHLSCYGYGRETTPHMDRVADEGVRCDRYYCSDAPCLPSRAALITGMFGIRNGVVGHGGTAADLRLMGKDRMSRCKYDNENFHNLFRRAGMYCASVSTFAERHSAWWFNAGFHETYNVGKGGLESGEEVLPYVLDWLERNQDRDNWYLHVHFWDPHMPYRTPAQFRNPFTDQPADTWITEETLQKHLKLVSPHGAHELNMYNDDFGPKYPICPGKVTNMEELKYWMDCYDGAVNYTDCLIGEIFDKLRALGIYEDTAIIITSDHGENLGELGIYSEHGTADEPTCHIPLIIKWPGCLKQYVDKDFHYNLDLMPTVADLLGIGKSANWDGKSFRDALTEGKSCGRDHLVISQMTHVCQRSARFGDWLYMRTYHDGFHLYFDREMLFNLADDPHEEHDLANEYPELCEKGAKIIMDWQDQMMNRSDSLVDPLWQVMKEDGPYYTRGQAETYAEQLRKTGRAEGADELLKRYGKHK